MQLFVLDFKFNSVDIIDDYDSLIWNDKYDECGDFELCIKMPSEHASYLVVDNYIQNTDSEHTMIIEKIHLETNAENEDTLIVSGRSLESILDRRIFWETMTISGNLEAAIYKVLSTQVIYPNDLSRRISQLHWVPVSSTSPIKSYTISDTMQFTGDNVYDVIVSLCKLFKIGFKIITKKNEVNNWELYFSLYAGLDHSAEQTTNSQVIFSPQFDNLLSGEYINDKTSFKNVTRVGGEGEGKARKYLTVLASDRIGLERREVFTDARDISSCVDSTTSLNAAQYQELLFQRGRQKLNDEHTPKATFNGEIADVGLYTYNVDYALGDLITLTNQYNLSATVRITQIVFSHDESGYYAYPKYDVVDQEDINAFVYRDYYGGDDDEEEGIIIG